jgi:hypothetical protein
MAFVYRKKERFDKKITPNNTLGPGYYIAQKPFISDTKQNIKPFNVNTKRYDFTKKQDTPGPGTYYNDSAEIISKLLNTSSHEKHREPFYRSIDYDNNITEPYNYILKDDRKDHLGFLSKDKRFSQTNKEIDIPGPGSYLNDSQFQQYSKKSGLNEARSLKSLNRSTMSFSKTFQNQVVSIPSKNKCFGYEIGEDSTIAMNLDPELKKKHKGTKENMVGPGQYDLTTNTWVKSNKGPSWGKPKTQKSGFEVDKLNKSEDLIKTYHERTFIKNQEAEKR